MNKINKLNYTSYELSKKLYELGLRVPKAEKWWCEVLGERVLIIRERYLRISKRQSSIPAFSLGLLMEILAWSIPKGCTKRFRADTEPDKKAKMLIYLIEQNHIKVEEINKIIEDVYSE